MQTGKAFETEAPKQDGPSQQYKQQCNSEWYENSDVSPTSCKTEQTALNSTND